MTGYTHRRVTHIHCKRVTSPTWGPLPPCKQARSEDWRIIVRSIINTSSQNYNDNEVIMTMILLTCRHFRITKTYMRNFFVWTKYSYMYSWWRKLGREQKREMKGEGEGRSVSCSPLLLTLLLPCSLFSPSPQCSCNNLIGNACYAGYKLCLTFMLKK